MMKRGRRESRKRREGGRMCVWEEGEGEEEGASCKVYVKKESDALAKRGLRDTPRYRMNDGFPVYVDKVCEIEVGKEGVLSEGLLFLFTVL